MALPHVQHQDQTGRRRHAASSAWPSLLAERVVRGVAGRRAARGDAVRAPSCSPTASTQRAVRRRARRRRPDRRLPDRRRAAVHPRRRASPTARRSTRRSSIRRTHHRRHTRPGPRRRSRRRVQDDLRTLLEPEPIAQLRAIYAGGTASTSTRSRCCSASDGRSARSASASRRCSSGQAAQAQMLHAADHRRPGGDRARRRSSRCCWRRSALRPIHVIRSGLARLGRGELDVNVDLPRDAELGDLGDSFKAVSARLAADRTELAGQRATLESVVDHLEDAVALVRPDGDAALRQPRHAAGARRRPAGASAELLPAGSSVPRRRRGRARPARDRATPQTVHVPGRRRAAASSTHPVADADGQLLGVMLVARNLTYLTQVESTLSYSRKLAALGRLSAGIAHEVKNPLNATMIHLELLEDAARRCAGRARARRGHRRPGAPARRGRAGLPEVHAARGPAAAAGVARAAHRRAACRSSRPRPASTRVDVRLDVPPDLPPASADPSLLQQAFLNLALNACQAMPDGGRLRIAAAAKRSGTVEIAVRGHRRRHLARTSRADLRPVLHDQGTRQRHRPVARLPDDPAARRRDRGAVDARPRHDVPGYVRAKRRRAHAAALPTLAARDCGAPKPAVHTECAGVTILPHRPMLAMICDALSPRASRGCAKHAPRRRSWRS